MTTQTRHAHPSVRLSVHRQKQEVVGLSHRTITSGDRVSDIAARRHERLFTTTTERNGYAIYETETFVCADGQSVRQSSNQLQYSESSDQAIDHRSPLSGEKLEISEKNQREGARH